MKAFRMVTKPSPKWVNDIIAVYSEILKRDYDYKRVNIKYLIKIQQSMIHLIDILIFDIPGTYNMCYHF